MLLVGEPRLHLSESLSLMNAEGTDGEEQPLVLGNFLRKKHFP